MNNETCTKVWKDLVLELPEARQVAASMSTRSLTTIYSNVSDLVLRDSTFSQKVHTVLYHNVPMGVLL